MVGRWLVALGLFAARGGALQASPCVSDPAYSDMEAYSAEVAIYARIPSKLYEPGWIAPSPDGASWLVTSDTGFTILDWGGSVLNSNSTAIEDAQVSGSWSNRGLWVAAISAVSPELDGVYELEAHGSGISSDLVCPLSGMAAMEPYGGDNGTLFVGASSDAVEGSCALVTFTPSLVCADYACWNPDFTDHSLSDLLVLGEDRVLAVSKKEGALYFVSQTEQTLLHQGYPLEEPFALAVNYDDSLHSWGGFDAFVTNLDTFDGLQTSVVGIALHYGDSNGTSNVTASLSVVAAAQMLDEPVSFFVNQSTGLMVISNHGSNTIAVAAPCDPNWVADDDDAPPPDDWLDNTDEVAVAVGAAIVLVAVGTILFRRRRQNGLDCFGASRMRPMAHSSDDLGKPLLDELRNDVVLEQEKWLINPKALQRGRLLGGGGVAQVFAGRYLGAAVAIKRIAVQLDENWATGVSSEAKLLATLSHPYILRFYGLAVRPDEYEVLIVTERCERSLQDWMDAEDEPFEVEDRRRVALQIAEAFVYLHNAKVLHRDLKPENVLLHEDGAVRIADFGVSRIISSATYSATGMIGTPGYLAPELIAAGFNSTTLKMGAVDVYSFGVLLNAMETRVRPYEELWAQEGFSMHKLLSHVADGGRPALGPDLTPDLEQLIADCWDANPRSRPVFTEVTERLREIAGASQFGRASFGLAAPCEPKTK